MALAATLVEDFAGPLDPAKWDVAGSQGVTLVGGRAVFSWTSATNAILRSANTYDFRGSEMFMHFPNVPSWPTVSWPGEVEFYMRFEATSGDYVEMGRMASEPSTWVSRIIEAGGSGWTGTSLDEGAQWGKIRAQAGSIDDLRSVDGITWESAWGPVTESWINNLDLAVGHLMFIGKTNINGGPFTASIDNFNTSTGVSGVTATRSDSVGILAT